LETFAKGEVVLFPFPYTDLSKRKLRPCLILSNSLGKDILLCQITSTEILPDNFSVSLKRNNLRAGDLFLDSYIRCNMLFTCNIDQIESKVGKVTNKLYSEVIDKIMLLINK